MNAKKFFTLYFLFSTIVMISQDFHTLYEKAKGDYNKNNFDSPSFDIAIKNCPDITKYPELLVYKGVSLEFKSENLLATKYIKIALSHLKDKEYIYQCHSLLGVIYSYSSDNDMDKALYHYKIALKLAQELKNDDYIYENKFNILLREYDFIEENNLEERKHHLKKMLDFYYHIPLDFKVDVRLMYMTIIIDLSRGELLIEDYKELKDNLKNDFEIKSLAKDFQGQFYNCNAILESYLKNYNMALKYCDSSYYISKNFLYKENILNDFYTYKSIYKQINNSELALKYSDSILKIEESFKIQELESGINLIDDNILLNKVIKENNKEKWLLNWVLIIFGFILILLIILFIIFRKKGVKLFKSVNYYKDNYNKLWANYQLSNNQLKKIKEELQNQTVSENKPEVKSIIKEINFHLNNNTNDEDKHVNIIKDKFIEELRQKAPYLSDKERLICFFINLNLPHKKIAELLNKSEKSIDSYKYRINKKLKDNHNINFENFIKSIKTK